MKKINPDFNKIMKKIYEQPIQIQIEILKYLYNDHKVRELKMINRMLVQDIRDAEADSQFKQLQIEDLIRQVQLTENQVFELTQSNHNLLLVQLQHIAEIRELQRQLKDYQIHSSSDSDN